MIWLIGTYASGHNLALGKPATQSSIYPHRIHAVAGYAVDGNTDGLNDFFGIRCNMKVLLIGVGTEVCFIRNTNLVVA
jgi:hypothetical protein